MKRELWTRLRQCEQRQAAGEVGRGLAVLRIQYGSAAPIPLDEALRLRASGGLAALLADTREDDSDAAHPARQA